MDYRELKAVVQALLEGGALGHDKNRGLLSWAQFRLAVAFADAQARAWLLDRVARPREVLKLGELDASVAIGTLMLANEIQTARRLGERLRKAGARESVHLMLVLAMVNQQAGETARALRYANRTLALAPNTLDAQLLRGELLLAGPGGERGIQVLEQLVAESGDVDLRARVAQALLSAEQYEALAAAMTHVARVEQVTGASPAHRSVLLNLMVHSSTRRGELTSAAMIAEKLLETHPRDPGSAIQVVRLKMATGEDGIAVLQAVLARLDEPMARAQVLAEMSRQALAINNEMAFDGAYSALRSLSRSDAGGWQELARGWRALRNKKMKAARAAFAAATRLQPNLAEAHLARALNEPKALGARLKGLTALAKKYRLPQAYAELARLQAKRGRLEEAAGWFERALWASPSVADPIALLVDWAELLDRTGRSQQSGELLLALAKNVKGDQRPIAQLVRLAKQVSDTGEAMRRYRALLEIFPDDLQMVASYAKLLIDGGKLEQARVYLQGYVDRDSPSRDPDVLAQFARIEKTRDPERALGLLQEAARLRPDAKVFAHLGSVSAELGRLESAKQAFTRACHLDARSADAWLGLARLQLQEGSVAHAKVTIAQFLEKVPDHQHAVELFGDALSRLGDAQGALEHYERLEARGRKRADLLVKMALCQQALGRRSQAESFLRRAVEANPAFPEAHFHLGVLLRQRGELHEARLELQNYVGLAPDGKLAPQARRAVDDILELEEDR